MCALIKLIFKEYYNILRFNIIKYSSIKVKKKYFEVVTHRYYII